MKYFLFSFLMIVLVACQPNITDNQGEQVQIAAIEQQSTKAKSIQPKNCYCEEQPNLSIFCDTTILTDKSSLYYQYTCDSIWLTLENSSNEKIILKTYNLDESLPEYHHRLHYHLEKEYPNYLLFRYSCPAQGVCHFDLIHKQTGNVVKTYEHIDNRTIYDEFIIFINKKSPLNYDLVVDYIEVDKQLTIPISIKEAFYPTDFYIIHNTVVNKNILTVQYLNSWNIEEGCEEIEIKIDLENERLVKN